MLRFFCKISAALIIAALVVFQAGMAVSDLTARRFVRILILKDVPEAEVYIRGAYEIVDPAAEVVLFRGRNLRWSAVSPSGDGILIGEQEYPLERLRLIPGKDVTVRVGDKNRRYRGRIDVIRKDKRLLVVNGIDLDDYIKGVLYHEVSDRWPLDAIMAQAVAARSYAVFQIQSKAKFDYDMTSDIYSQVYGGRTSEHFRTNIAVNRTKGEILTYKGKVVPAYFHATCAGRTEDVSELWKQDLPPLKGVACGFCGHSPHMAWKKNFQSKAVQEKLNQKGYRLGLIKDIIVSRRNASGRIKELEIETRDGQRTKISGKDFREILGPNVIRSNMYEIQMRGYYFDVVGQGWGHGVGLCQWGAYGMSMQRYTYREILRHYYPGAEITLFRGTDKY
ncbi:MAG: SpoIID/LytB domain-containing protein [Candidatus Omnitrophota bacterium]|nr:SpoIID/LytB domain-containing protein [Candidatus Omnitrophota bacterium]MDZ4242967.1 SpoIID/LytB domain-containing protein [Candidatus Omnitrophota bacterium]